ncbi:hypothetical protein BC834DRAFT_870255 [Gloeopeniophorella convolvens]|nr:hypothetical protein BC834DRAFT_870255 [Gloeopeniophorella convolvens]
MEPTLPPELWLHIFESATDTPGAYDPDVSDAFTHPSTELPHLDNSHERAVLHASLSTRRVLVRVCRQWRALATPLLYHALWLGHPRALRALVYTLRHKPELGAHVRRLDVALRTTEDERGKDHRLREMRDHLIRILTHTPCLEIFVVNFCQPGSWHIPCWMSAKILTALRDTCGPSLRRLCWVGDHMNSTDYKYHRHPGRKEVISLLRRTPNLRTLIGLPIPMDANLFVVLPHLTFAHFSMYSFSVVPVPSVLARFPTLQYTRLVHDEPSNWALRLAEDDYLEDPPDPDNAVGNVTSAEMDPAFIKTAYVTSPAAFRGISGIQVAKVFLSALEWPDYAGDCPPHHFPSMLTHLGIATKGVGGQMWEESAFRVSDMARFIEWALACKDVAQGLCVIRLSNDPGSAYLANNPEYFGDGLVRLAERGIRVENAEGLVLEPPASGGPDSIDFDLSLLIDLLPVEQTPWDRADGEDPDYDYAEHDYGDGGIWGVLENSIIFELSETPFS